MSSRADDPEWRHRWDIDSTASFIVDRSLSRVALQLPDELLHQAALLSSTVQQTCKSLATEVQVFVLADTSYNSEGVDEVAAQHVNADCVIHYGRASLSPVSTLPTYFVFGRQPLDITACAQRIADYSISSGNLQGVPALIVVPDQPYSHAANALQARLDQVQCPLAISVAEITSRILEPSTSHSNRAGPDAHDAAACKGTTTCMHDCQDESSHAGKAQGRRNNSLHADASAAGAAEVAREIRSSPASADCATAAAAAAAAAAELAELSDSQATSACEREQIGDLPAGHEPHRMGPYRWRLPRGTPSRECVYIWVGPDDSPLLTQLQMWRSDSHWAMWDPCGDRWQEGLPLHITSTLKRRYYLVEKARNARIVGILVGTLGVAGYRGVVERVRAAAKGAGKKTYTVLMGKPSPYKLANFPEVEVFVMIADLQGQILDSKEYMAPIITPQEALIAFSDNAEWSQSEWSTEFDSILQTPQQQTATSEPRFSLLDGGLHGDDSSRAGDESTKAVENGDHEQQKGQLAIRPETAISIIFAPGSLAEIRGAADYYLARRKYRGLEAPITGAEPKEASVAVAGRSGRAAAYEQEPGKSDR